MLVVLPFENLGPPDVEYFTDGVTEATNSRGELFGEQLLVSILVDNRDKSAEELVQLVIDSVNEFVSEDFELDDLTLIVVKAG